MMIAEDLRVRLMQYGITDLGEVALREALEARCESYTLIKLAPWAARRWKCYYRLMMRDNVYDAQSVAEAYAMGLLAALTTSPAPHEH